MCEWQEGWGMGSGPEYSRALSCPCPVLWLRWAGQVKQAEVKGQAERRGSLAKSVPHLPSRHHDGAKYGGYFLFILPVSIFCA